MNDEISAKTSSNPDDGTSEGAEAPDRTVVTLSFIGKDLDAAEVNRLLEVSASWLLPHAENAGDFDSSEGAPLQIWKLPVECSIMSLDEQINRLFDNLSQDLAVWRTLSRKYRGGIVCSVAGADTGGPIYFPSSTLNRISERQLYISCVGCGAWMQPPSDSGTTEEITRCSLCLWLRFEDIDVTEHPCIAELRKAGWHYRNLRHTSPRIVTLHYKFHRDEANGKIEEPADWALVCRVIRTLKLDYPSAQLFPSFFLFTVEGNFHQYVDLSIFNGLADVMDFGLDIDANFWPPEK